MKRFAILFIGLIFLTAWGSKVELSDYIEVDFLGYDGIGQAHYRFIDNQMDQDAFGVTEEDYWDLSYDETQAIDNFMMSFTAQLSQVSELCNGDEVTVRFNVDEEMTNKLKSKDEITVTVSGLEEPTELSDEEIDRNVIVNFNGLSGRGRIQIDTTFDGDLYDLQVETDQDGQIANGDLVTVSVTQESRDNLAYMGYALSGDGAVEFEASGLDIVPESVDEIENLSDIERMIGEGVNRRYQDSNWGRYTYEIIEGNTYYRQFEPESEGEWGAWTTHGSVKIGRVSCR